MNILGVGTAELVVILLIMIVVAGPKRMLQWAYWMGVYFGKARRIFAQMMTLVQEEIKQAGVEVTLPKELPNRAQLNQWSRDALKPLLEPVEKALKEAEELELRPDSTPNQLTADPAHREQLGSWNDLLKAKPTPPNNTFGTWSQPTTPQENKDA